MKHLPVLVFLASFGILFGQITIPFDWGGQNGMIIHEGSLFWNRSWSSGNLIFDGTYSSFPNRYGKYSAMQFKSLNTGTLPVFKSLPDSARTASHIDYIKGDYIYDQLDLRAKYEAKNQWIHINGFKRTYGGNTGYYLHPTGGRSPIHHAYRFDYGVMRDERQVEVSAGRFVTRSGLPDSIQNGSEDDNIFSAGFRIKQPWGKWQMNGHLAQFTQHRKVIHSSLADSNYRDINRNLINLQMNSQDGMAFGLEQQIQQISSSIHNRFLAWTKIYGKKQIGLLSLTGGIQILNSGDAFPFVWEVDYKQTRGNIFLEIVSSGSPFPKHPDLDDPSDDSSFDYWSRSSIRVGYNVFGLEVNGMLALDQNNILGSNNAFITFTGTEIQYQLNNGWGLFASYYTQIDTSIFLGGIGTYTNTGIKGRFNLFSNSMKLDATLWATGNQGRLNTVAFNPILHIPFYHRESDWVLSDQWLVNFEAKANISGVIINYKINNVLNALGETEDKAWAQQNYLFPPLGRMIQFGISWSFND